MALDWLPIVPAWLPALKRRAWMEPVVRQNVSPLPNAAPPAQLSWHPTYPDFARARVFLRVPNQSTRTGFLGPPVADLRWLPIAPAWIARRRLPTAAQSIGSVQDLGALLDLPKRGGWRPIYPAWIARRTPVRTGTSVWLVDPTTLLNAAPCVELGSESLMNPLLATETLINPAFATETLVNPSVGSEDLC